MTTGKKSKFVPVFTIYKEGATTTGAVTILKQSNDGNYNTNEKMQWYKSLGYTVTPIVATK